MITAHTIMRALLGSDKPHIYLERGYWRLKVPHRWHHRLHGEKRYHVTDSYTFVHKLNNDVNIQRFIKRSLPDDYPRTIS